MSEQPISTPDAPGTPVDRRRFLAACSAAGLGGTLFPGALLALATPPLEAQSPDAAQPLAKITPAMIDAAAVIAGLTLPDDVKTMMLDGLTSQRDSTLEIRKLALPNSVGPSFAFDPVPPGMVLETTKKPLRISPAPKVAS